MNRAHKDEIVESLPFHFRLVGIVTGCARLLSFDMTNAAGDFPTGIDELIGTGGECAKVAGNGE
jgi:hypothetical protein